MRLLLQHGLAVAAMLAVLASWLLIFPLAAPMALERAQHRTSSGSFAASAIHMDVSLNVEPLGMVLTVLAIAGICTLARAGRSRWPFLSWALPFVAALLAGMVAGFSLRGAAATHSIRLVSGVATGFIAFTLVGAYWWTLLLTSQRRGPEVTGSGPGP